MILTWERPQSTAYPRVWHEFVAKNKATNQLDKYCIQDLPESKTDEALEFLIQPMMKDEPIMEAYGV